MTSLIEGAAETTEIIAAPDHATEQGRASDDDQLVEIWLHGRSEHTMRAYRADVERFRVRAGKPLARVTLSDLQQFAVALEGTRASEPVSDAPGLQSLLAFGYRIGSLPFDAGRGRVFPPVATG